jgi:hypothetical protein
MTDTPQIAPTLLAFVDEIDVEVGQRWNFDRAYQVAGGPFLTVATRLGWPAADRALSFVLAVRRLAHMGRPPEGQAERRDLAHAQENYQAQRDTLRAWLAEQPC